VPISKTPLATAPQQKAVAKREAFELQAEQLLLPLSYSIRAAQVFSKWGIQVARTRQGEERDNWRISFRIWKLSGSTALTNTSSQSSPFLAETEPRALCTIFETLNRTGVKLSVF